MTVQCCVAPPAAGKTKACIDKIRSVLRNNPFSEIWVIVPGSLQAVHFRRRLAQAGGAVGVTVGTIQNFSARILEKKVDSLPTAPAPFIHSLLRKSIAEVHAQGKLTHLAPIKDFPGFIAVLRDSFRELKFALVTPTQFSEAVQDDGSLEQEMARIYQVYNQKLESLGWIDSSDFSHRAVSNLEKSPGLLSGLRLVVVDGFDSFTPAESKFLFQLSTQASEMLITLPGEPDGSRVAHRRAQQGLDILRENVDLEVVALSSPHSLPTELAKIEETLFIPAAADFQGYYPAGQPAPTLCLEAFSPEVEVRESLRWLKSLIVRQGVVPSDCAIFVTDRNLYEPAIRLAAREFSLPVHFFNRREFLTYPVGRALQNLIELPLSDYASTSLFNFLRSPFFRAGFSEDRSAVDDLDELCRYARITASRPQWDELFNRLLKVDLDQAEAETRDFHRKSLPSTDRVRQLQVFIDQVFEVFESFVDQRFSLAGWVTAFEGFLSNLGFYELAVAEAGDKVLEPFFDSLRAVVLSESVLGGDIVDFSTFAQALIATITSLSLPEPVEFTPSGTILVGSFLEARAVRYKAVCVMGLGEGSYPRQERPDPFLPESLRKKLRLESRLGRDQASLFYQAATRSDQYLLFTRAYHTENGEPWEPSPYWNGLVEWLGKGVVRTVDSSERLTPQNAASLQELFFSSDGVLPDGDPRHQRMLDQLGGAADILRSRRHPGEFDRYDGYIPELEDGLASHFGPNAIYSASQAETFGTCPFYFFSQNVLKLEERLEPEEDYDVGQLGSIFHLILEKLYREAEENQNYEQLLDDLPRVANQVFKIAPNKFGFRVSALWVSQQKEILRVLRKCLIALGSFSEGWKPLYFEKKFGFTTKEAFWLDVNGEKILFRGSIDRVDRNEQTGALRVIDYKSGSTMDKNEFFKNKRLQFVLYALAVEEFFKLGEVGESIYWSVRAGGKIGPWLTQDEANIGKTKSEIIEIVKQMILDFVTNIRGGHFEPIKPEEDCPIYCPASQWCWHYVARDTGN